MGSTYTLRKKNLSKWTGNNHCPYIAFCSFLVLLPSLLLPCDVKCAWYVGLGLYPSQPCPLCKVPNFWVTLGEAACIARATSPGRWVDKAFWTVLVKDEVGDLQEEGELLCKNPWDWLSFLNIAESRLSAVTATLLPLGTWTSWSALSAGLPEKKLNRG